MVICLNCTERDCFFPKIIYRIHIYTVYWVHSVCVLNEFSRIKLSGNRIKENDVYHIERTVLFSFSLFFWNTSTENTFWKIIRAKTEWLVSFFWPHKFLSHSFCILSVFFFWITYRCGYIFCEILFSRRNSIHVQSLFVISCC